MKNFYLNFSMNHEDGRTLQFLEELEKFEESLTINTEEGTLYPIVDGGIANIYINCTGGENRMAALLYNFFKQSQYDYNFIVHGDFSSNAILIMLALNPKYISIMRQCSSIIHLSNYNHPVANIALNNQNHSSLNDFNDFKEYLNCLLILYKSFLSKEEIITIRQGGDVFLSSSRVLNLFNKLKRDKSLQKKAKNIFEITL